MKKDLKSALGKSLSEETKAVEKRFAQADQIFNQNKPEVLLTALEDSEKPQQPKIDKVIRDSFTLPSEDYQLIEVIKKKALKATISINKSEVIRAGLLALQNMSEEDLVKVINSLTKVKSGRRSINGV